MSHITTYSKIYFDPMHPQQDKININDIAHALSLTCRANGHFKHFYSVGQHSINCMREAQARGYSTKVQLACLLHDASEAYISDITRPVKKRLTSYKEIEDNLQNQIWTKWLDEPLDENEHCQVFEVDDTLFYYEFMFFMQERVLSYTPQLYSKPDFDFINFTKVEESFLRCFRNFFEHDTASLTIGVDWCKGKWLAVKQENLSLEYQKFNNIEELCLAYANADAILIDIPIGLAESSDESHLRPDRLVAKKLGKRRSSVFNVPFRQIAMAEDITEAWDLSRELNAKMQPLGMALRNSIKQVDIFLQSNVLWKNKLMESHPEYAFMTLNNNNPLIFSKLTQEGQNERISILSKYCDGVTKLIDKYKTDVPYRKKTDDLLDALCLSVIGQLGLTNGFLTTPENPHKDRTGLNMQIVTAKI